MPAHVDAKIAGAEDRGVHIFDRHHRLAD